MLDFHARAWTSLWVPILHFWHGFTEIKKTANFRKAFQIFGVENHDVLFGWSTCRGETRWGSWRGSGKCLIADYTLAILAWFYIHPIWDFIFQPLLCTRLLDFAWWSDCSAILKGLCHQMLGDYPLEFQQSHDTSQVFLQSALPLSWLFHEPRVVVVPNINANMYRLTCWSKKSFSPVK